MKIVLDATKFREALRTVQALLPEHDIIMTADKDKGHIVIEAGYQGVYVKQTLNASVHTAGSAVISSPVLSGLHMKDKIELNKLTTSKIQVVSGSLRCELELKQDGAKIEALRPDKEIETPVEIPRDQLTRAVGRTNFMSTLNVSQQGLRLQFDDYIKVSTTDQYRATLYKEKLLRKMPAFDVVLKSSFMTQLLQRWEERELWFGEDQGTIKIACPSIEVIHPAIQVVQEDVEAWINDIDENERKCLIATNVEAILDTINGASSIVTGSLSYETKLECKITKKNLLVLVTASHGEAQNELTLDESDAATHEVQVSSKYTGEMLGLMKEGLVRIGFWESFMIITSGDGTSFGVLPTINNNA